VALAAGAGAWSWVRHERRGQEIAADVARARAGLARDTHAALRASAETLEAVLALEPNHPVARALHAQARALLAATYGDGDVDAARRLVEAVDPQAEPGAVLTARRALARDEAERRAVDDAILAAPPGHDPGLDSLAGVVLLSRGQTAPAIERFNAAIAAGAGHAPTFVRVADYYRGRGEHEDALRYYALALAVAEDHPGAVLGAAQSRLATATDPAQLRETLAGLDRLSPAGAVPVGDRARLALLRSRILSALDDRAGAVAALRGVEDLVGPDREGRVALASALADAGALDGAEAILQALVRGPEGGGAAVDDPAVREALARVLLARDRNAEVTALPAGPEERTLHLYQGIAWLRQGDPAKARVELRATATPDNKLPADAVAYLALADLAAGDVARARTNLERVGTGPRARPTGRWAYGTSLVAQGKLDDATQAFQAALATDPRHLEARCALGRLLLARGQVGPAIQELTRVTEANPFHREALVALGLAHLAADEVAPALERLRAARALAPEDPVSGAALALALLRDGKLPEAEEFLKRAGPSRDPVVLRAHGELALARGDAAGAIASLAAVAAATPDVAVLAALGDAQLSQGDGRAALATFARARKVGPDAPHARLGLARAETAVGRAPAAEKELLELLASLPASTPAESVAAAHAALADALLGRPREHERALGAAREAVRLAPHSAAGQLALAKVLAQAGEGAQAEPAFARAVELAPGDASYRLARGLFLAERASGTEEARRELTHAIELAPKGPVATAAKAALRRLR
jgi:tetratricopeptide (TPR) repeat protein